MTLAPRAEARLADKQLVLIYSNGRIFAFLEGFVDAEPTRGAELEATVNFLADRLVEVGPGLYRSGPLALSSGRNDVEIAWRIGADEGTATLPVEVSGTIAAESDLTGLPPPNVPGWVFLAAGGLLYAGTTGLFLVGAKRRLAKARSDAPSQLQAAE